MARPREFDEDEVLEAALGVFWERGYESTSLRDVLAATGLKKSSVYKAFGSKEALFWRTVERYRRDFLNFRENALAEATPRRVAERLLEGTIELNCGGRRALGCLEMNTAVAGSAEAEPIRHELARSRERFRQRFRDRFDEITATAPLPPGVTSDDAASFIISVINGLAVLAKEGGSRETARRVVQVALLSWPAS